MSDDDDWESLEWQFGHAVSDAYKKGRKSMQAERDAAIARAEAAEAQVAALTAKVDALCAKGQCGCSWDREGDVCEYHSPKLVAAKAQVANLREALAAVVARSENGELGTSKVQDMARIARAALAGKEPADG